jgi:hypothetical protein
MKVYVFTISGSIASQTDVLNTYCMLTGPLRRVECSVKTIAVANDGVLNLPGCCPATAASLILVSDLSVKLMN